MPARPKKSADRPKVAPTDQVPSTLDRPADPRPNAVDVDELPPLSEGEKQDLIMNGSTVSPFNGQIIVARDFGLKPASEQAEANQKRALEQRAAAARGEEPAPVSTADAAPVA